MAALLLALIASAELAIGRHIIGVALGLLGALAINLFAINMFYVFALPLWLAAALPPS
jgi:hypothetical protein